MRTSLRVAAAAVILVSSTLVGLMPASAPASTAPGGGDTFTATKKVTRQVYFGSVPTARVTTNDVTVHVDHTQNLRGRERVVVSWSGAEPSSGRPRDPYGAGGLLQERPVVILQCRGTVDAIKPETCYTSSAAQRSTPYNDPDNAIWRRDPAWPGGTAPAPSCGTTDSYTVPFIRANGKQDSACGADHMPPEAGVDGAMPPADVAGFTGPDGTGSIGFEIRTDIENESLGCNSKVACSLVVVPIAGTSCAAPPSGPDLLNKNCSSQPSFAPGSANYAGDPVTPAVAANYWWTPSQWANRIAVPLTFGLPPNTCDILDTRPPTGFYGTELMAQASLQWAPAYCLNKSRFKYQHNQMSDAAGFALMQGGGAAAALVSSEHDAAGARVGYAPTAVTGFGIGYVIDKPLTNPDGTPGAGGAYTDLKLNARLIAKLITQSYTGNTIGAGHPGMGSNPQSINADPEFQKLNPGLSKGARIDGSTLLSLSESSDALYQLTDYIKHDKDALAFVNGKADPSGMVVNPNYKGYALPRAIWEMRDTFIPKTSDPCMTANPNVLLSQIAAPVSRLYTISQALIDAWPNIQTRCDTDLTQTPPYKTGRIARQGYGSRFILGLISLGDAARYGLPTAALETTPGNFVRATPASEAAAVKLMKQKKALSPFGLDQGLVRKSRTAYPGTMVVYTAAKTCDLNAADVKNVASFIDISITEGQRPGSGNGQLPGGFVPIARTGATAPLFTAAKTTGAAVRKQACPGTPAAPAADPAPAAPGAAPAAPVVPAPAAAGAPAPAAAGGAPAPTAAPTTEAAISLTAAPRAPIGFVLLPALFLLTLIAALASGLLRLVVARRR